jgi:phenylalanyl-tRNA synthetase beta chain
VFGELHPRVLKVLGMKGPVVGFEVVLDLMPEPKRKDGKARPALALSPFHPVRRDFAFVLDQEVTAEKLLRAAKGADKAMITNVELFDLYCGEGIGPGKKSLAITVTLQPTDKTLTEDEIAAISGKIVAQVEKATGGSLRG